MMSNEIVDVSLYSASWCDDEIGDGALKGIVDLKNIDKMNVFLD